MPRWIGFIGSWALLVLGLGLVTIAAAGEWINVRDARRLGRLQVVDRLIAEHNQDKVGALRDEVSKRESNLAGLQTKADSVNKTISDLQDSNQVITVSTAENRVYVRRGDQVVYQAVCATGKGPTTLANGKTMVFDTPVGKFHIKSKEEHPMWVPPDWHYEELASKKGMSVVRLGNGQSIDADTGAPARSGGTGVWSWLGDSGSSRTLTVRNNQVVLVQNGTATPLPPGEIITAGNTVVIPPVGTPQRQFDKVLGNYRLNLGDGYALHGTQDSASLGRNVSHGCVRLGDKDIEALYSLANVGDEVIIY